MAQKKLNQKKSQKSQDKSEMEKRTDQSKSDKDELKNEINNNDVKITDENNNKKVQLKSDFCKENHFVCFKFSNDQFNLIHEKLSKLKDDPELVDQLDIDHLDQILNDHHLQTRYMMRARYDLDKQMEFIIRALKWRKENHISVIRKELFPREPFEMAPVFPFKKTKKNEIVVYLRFCLYPHTSIDFMDEFSLLQLYLINELAMKHNTTWIFFFDFSNATKNNVDIKRSRFMIDCMNTYFPFANSKSIVYNLPWYLSWLKPLFFSFLPAHIKRIVAFYDPKNLNELIDSDNLPEFLGKFFEFIFKFNHHFNH